MTYRVVTNVDDPKERKNNILLFNENEPLVARLTIDEIVKRLREELKK